MCLLLYVNTPPLDHAHPLLLLTKEDLGTIAVLPMSQSDCSPLVPAFPQSCPDTTSGRLGKMLVTSSHVPLRTLMVGGRESMQRNEMVPPFPRVYT